MMRPRKKDTATPQLSTLFPTLHRALVLMMREGSIIASDSSVSSQDVLRIIRPEANDILLAALNGEIIRSFQNRKISAIVNREAERFARLTSIEARADIIRDVVCEVQQQSPNGR